METLKTGFLRTRLILFLSDSGIVHTWGYGLLGAGPSLTFSERPVPLKPALFGRNELQLDVNVIDVQCGLYHFAALTGKETHCEKLFFWGSRPDPTETGL